MKKFNNIRETPSHLICEATPEYSSYLLGKKTFEHVYIHVTRETGFILAYVEQDIKRPVNISREELDNILLEIEDKR